MSSQKITEYVVSFVISAVTATFLSFIIITGIRLTEGHEGLIIVLGFLTGWFVYQTIKNYILFMRSL